MPKAVMDSTVRGRDGVENHEGGQVEEAREKRQWGVEPKRHSLEPQIQIYPRKKAWNVDSIRKEEKNPGDEGYTGRVGPDRPTPCGWLASGTHGVSAAGRPQGQGAGRRAVKR